MEAALDPQAVDIAGRLLANVEHVVHGKSEEIRLVTAAFLCRGHVLLEDVPGTAKTVLARALAASITDATATRIQCTPDLQPSDTTGLSVYDQRTRDFEFRPGPIFANIVLVDEINRATPKAQSALLEAMAEGQVTVDGETRQLPDPFLLIATENPIEYEGTFPLPEAQLDRFVLRTALGYPGLEDELLILEEQRRGHHPLEGLRAVVSIAELDELREAVADVFSHELIRRWIAELVRSSRDLPIVSVGASVRASLALERLSRAWALLHGRHFVIPSDVEHLFLPVVGHRVRFSPAFLAETRRQGHGETLRRLRETCFERVPRPEADWEPAARSVR